MRNSNRLKRYSPSTLIGLESHQHCRSTNNLSETYCNFFIFKAYLQFYLKFPEFFQHSLFIFSSFNRTLLIFVIFRLFYNQRTKDYHFHYHWNDILSTNTISVSYWNQFWIDTIYGCVVRALITRGESDPIRNQWFSGKLERFVTVRAVKAASGR